MTALLKGALIEYGGDFLGPLPNVVIFQFNPEQLSRTINIPERPGERGARAARTREHDQTPAPPIETFTLTAHFSAADDLGRGDEASALARTYGVGPQLAALEKMVYPAGIIGGLLGSAVDAVGDLLRRNQNNNNINGGANQATRPVPREQTPRLLFVWGFSRVLPVEVQSMSMTEQKFDFMLNPVQAEVQLGLAVKHLAANSKDLLGLGASHYSNMIKEAQAVLHLAKTTAGLVADIISF